MIFRAKQSYNFHPVGLYIHAGKVLGPWGSCALKDVPKSARLYAHSEQQTLWDAKDLGGIAKWWKKRYVRFEIQGYTIRTLHDVFSRESPENAMESLNAFAEWLAKIRITPVSLSGISKSIWTKSLSHDLLLFSSTLPVPHESLIIGARQEAIPGVYEEAEYWDIRSAYQHSMKNLMVGGRYRHFSHEPHRFRLSEYQGCVGFARAHIYFPQWQEIFGPIPIGQGRIVSFPKSGRVEGIYDLNELRLAAEMGATILIYESWVAHGIRVPFKQWAEIIDEGRNLPNPGAAKLAKRMANTLWASFAVSGRGATFDFSKNPNDPEYKILDKNETKPLCRGVSAHIASQIRVRLYREALAFMGAGPFCISVHTDGAIFLPPAYPNGPRGNAVGDWRIKYGMKDLTLVGAQAYRFTDAETNRQLHIVAGCPPGIAQKVFSSMLRKATDKRARASSRLPGLLYSGETD